MLHMQDGLMMLLHGVEGFKPYIEQLTVNQYKYLYPNITHKKAEAINFDSAYFL